MAQNYRRSLTKRRKARQGPAGEDFKNGLHLAKFEKRQPTFFQIYISLYQNVIYTAGKSFSD